MFASKRAPSDMKNQYHHLFGPVPSRRFGRSLGIDLTPCKTCSLDCVFCQLGRTSRKTVTREEYVPTNEVLNEIEDWLQVGGAVDYITLSGSGEPTLHARFGDVLTFIRSNTAVPAVLLTNGTMLHLPEAREAAAVAEVVKVSLSAWDQVSYELVNRPHPSLRFDQLVAGQKAFRAGFAGQLWMEIFLLEGMNASRAEVQRIAEVAREIGPDRIQLNTVARPPAETFATAVSEQRVVDLARLFHPSAEIIAAPARSHNTQMQVNEGAILAMLRRRPCTAQQVADAFGMHRNEVSKYLGALLRTGEIREERSGSETYYTAVGETGGR